MRREPSWDRDGPALARLALLVAVAATGCSSATLNTTVLPPHRLEDPICPLAVIVHEDPSDVPPGGRLIAQIRVQGGNAKLSSEKMRRRLRGEAAALGANRVLAVEFTTPSTLATLGMGLVQGWGSQQERDRIRNESLTDQQRTAAATAPVPTDQSFYGRGLAYAIFLPYDTLRTNLECAA
jgi:hypothetical protein